MIRQHTCPNGHSGELWLPLDAVNTIVKCPTCGEEEDVKHLLPLSSKLREELEMQEYKRLEKIYGGGS